MRAAWYEDTQGSPGQRIGDEFDLPEDGTLTVPEGPGRVWLVTAMDGRVTADLFPSGVVLAQWGRNGLPTTVNDTPAPTAAPLDEPRLAEVATCRSCGHRIIRLVGFAGAQWRHDNWDAVCPRPSFDALIRGPERTT